MFRSKLARLALVSSAGGLGAAGAVTAFSFADARHPPREIKGHVPTREKQWEALKRGTQDDPYDVLIIGGGATGTGCALDAATRCGRLARSGKSLG